MSRLSCLKTHSISLPLSLLCTFLFSLRRLFSFSICPFPPFFSLTSASPALPALHHLLTLVHSCQTSYCADPIRIQLEGASLQSDGQLLVSSCFGAETRERREATGTELPQRFFRCCLIFVISQDAVGAFNGALESSETDWV